ncbi:hypothetical protein Taro_005678 [Colocasia esculenta]|uniref:Uncharacterized protein n=1 Tax=Colocasia esculenta TaxID=4460 RepID=A0A843TV82_COLES|nr:hypothetical protein [Colocasia esculenta]
MRRFLGRFEVLVEFLVRSHREDVAWSGGNTERTPVFAFFTKGCACEGDRPCRRDKVATGRPVVIGFPIAIEWYLVVTGIVEELCSVKVVWCDFPLVLSPFSGTSSWLAVMLLKCLRFACEACNLGSVSPVWLIA